MVYKQFCSIPIAQAVSLKAMKKVKLSSPLVGCERARRIHDEFAVNESPEIAVERPELPDCEVHREVNAKLLLFEFVRADAEVPRV